MHHEWCLWISFWPSCKHFYRVFISHHVYQTMQDGVTSIHILYFKGYSDICDLKKKKKVIKIKTFSHESSEWHHGDSVAAFI